MERAPARAAKASSNRRLYVWYGFLLLVIVIIILRLFYLQIIRHDYYRQQALNDQLKQYSIAAERGIIEAHQGSSVVPLVLNQKLYTLYADPTLVKNASDAASKIAAITHGNTDAYTQLMKTKNTRYVILGKRLSETENNRITALKLPGVGLQAQDYRVYPQGDLASQLLGFVNDAGQGTYGIEQFFNKQLEGTPGQLKAITDVNGVPLAASRDNIQINPTPGDNLVLTIDMAMQRQVEMILKQAVQNVHAKSASVVLMDPNTGAIKAMANYPTYDPSKFYDVKDVADFNNAAVADPLEVGSIMKTLTMSAGLNQGVITPDSTYYDPGYVKVDGATIKNVLDIPHEPVSIKEILKYSLNTGAVHVLKQIGGGQLDQKGRDIWYDYMTNHYQLGKLTGIEQPNEAPGVIPNPDHGYGLNLQYANTAFGQGMTATILQMASAVSSVLNGGTYYQPHLVDEQISPSGAVKQNPAKVVKSDVVKPQVGKDLQSLMEYVFNQNYNVYETDRHPGYLVGGKTGTGQIAAPGGGYKVGTYNGTFLGFVGKTKPEYVVGVLVNQPDLPGYDSAGSQAAAPIFGKIADMLINDFGGEPD
ncbi:MAG TPA: penicillin-binding protein 2 [Candidatus Saccharimonadales bacterium]|nr:penicillin-binding protein 2 [Candidatus Saccharimonadales bacterium]